MDGVTHEFYLLVDEREAWRFEMKKGMFNELYVLQQYRENRESNLWRATREVEKLCEYVLFLESKLTEQMDIK